MRTKISVALTVLLICISSACYASETDRWEWIMSTDTVDFYFDKETIRYGTKDEWDSNELKYKKVIDKAKIFVYIKEVYTEGYREKFIEEIKAGRGWDISEFVMRMSYGICKFEYDYLNNQIRKTEGIYYDLDGRVLFDSKNEYASWGSIIPGSNGEGMFKLIRAYSEKNNDKVAKQTLQ